MRKKKKAEISEKVKNLTDFKEKKTDPQGSWTGVPEDSYEKPQQDADDL